MFEKLSIIFENFQLYARNCQFCSELSIRFGKLSILFKKVSILLGKAVLSNINAGRSKAPSHCINLIMVFKFESITVSENGKLAFRRRLPISMAESALTSSSNFQPSPLGVPKFD